MEIVIRVRIKITLDVSKLFLIFLSCQADRSFLKQGRGGAADWLLSRGGIRCVIVVRYANQTAVGGADRGLAMPVILRTSCAASQLSLLTYSKVTQGDNYFGMSE